MRWLVYERMERPVMPGAVVQELPAVNPQTSGRNVSMSIVRSLVAALICIMAVPSRGGNHRRLRQPRRQCCAVQRALGRPCRPRRQRSHRRAVPVGVHDPARAYPAQQDLRDARRPLRLSPGKPRGCHPNALGRLPGRHPRLDQRAWRSAQGFHLDGRTGRLSIFPPVLNRATLHYSDRVVASATTHWAHLHARTPRGDAAARARELETGTRMSVRPGRAQAGSSAAAHVGDSDAAGPSPVQGRIAPGSTIPPH